MGNSNKPQQNNDSSEGRVFGSTPLENEELNSDGEFPFDEVAEVGCRPFHTIRNETLDESVAAIREHMIGVFDPDQVRLTEDLIVEIEKLKNHVFLEKDEKWRNTTPSEETLKTVEETVREVRLKQAENNGVGVLGRNDEMSVVEKEMDAEALSVIANQGRSRPKFYRVTQTDDDLPATPSIDSEKENISDRGTPFGFERE